MTNDELLIGGRERRPWPAWAWGESMCTVGATCHACETGTLTLPPELLVVDGWGRPWLYVPRAGRGPLVAALGYDPLTVQAMGAALAPALVAWARATNRRPHHGWLAWAGPQ